LDDVVSIHVNQYSADCGPYVLYKGTIHIAIRKPVHVSPVNRDASAERRILNPWTSLTSSGDQRPILQPFKADQQLKKRIDIASAMMARSAAQ
jgi:hypothetical protein